MAQNVVCDRIVHLRNFAATVSSAIKHKNNENSTRFMLHYGMNCKRSINCTFFRLREKSALETTASSFFLIVQEWSLFSLCGCDWSLTGVSCARFECPLKTKPCASIGQWLNTGRSICPTPSARRLLLVSVLVGSMESVETRDHCLCNVVVMRRCRHRSTNNWMNLYQRQQ